MQKFTKFIRELRKARGLSQEELGERMGFSNSVISRMESGKRKLTPEIIKHYESLCFSADEKEKLWRLYKKTEFVQVYGEENFRLSSYDLREAPESIQIIGREKELKNLHRWIEMERVRIVTVTGIGGIGKTTLIRSLVEKIEDNFDYVIWRSLKNTTPLKQFVETWIRILSLQQHNPIPEELTAGINVLMDQLANKRVLLVLDNVELIMAERKRAGRFQFGYEEYGDFFQRIATSTHQSCLILTSRELPRDLARLAETDKLQTRTMTLSGLSSKNFQEVLSNRNIQGSPDQWHVLTQRTAGNPLAMIAESGTIIKHYGGEIGSFLSQVQTNSGEINLILLEHYARLEAVEQMVMIWLAVSRESLSLIELNKNFIPSIPDMELQEILKSLSGRALIQGRNGLYTLIEAFSDFVIGDLINRIYREIINGEVDLLNTIALIQAQSKEFIRKNQTQIILKPLTERLKEILGLEGLIDQLMGIIVDWRNNKKLRPGYLAGNIINILHFIKMDFTGADFSQLEIRQAFLREKRLMGVNFIGSRFIDSVFDDTFGSILAVKFDDSGKYLAAGVANGELRLWETGLKEPVFIFPRHKDWIWSVDISRDGQKIACGSGDRQISVWDIHKKQRLFSLEGHEDQVRTIKFSPDNKLLASGGDDHVIRLWDLGTGEELFKFDDHKGWIRSVDFHPNGEFLVSGSDDGKIGVWNLNDKKGSILAGHLDRVRTVQFNNDGSLLATGGDDCQIIIWETNSWTVKSTLSYDGHRVRSLVFAPEINWIISAGGDKMIRIWDIDSGSCIETLKGHTDRVRSISINNSVRGLQLASGSEDQTIRFWDIQGGNCIRVLKGYTNRVREIAFNRDGRLLASALENRTIRIWDISTKSTMAILKGHNNRVRSVVFCPDGLHLLSCSEDGTIRVWTVHSRRCIQEISAHDIRVRSLAIDSSGEIVASAGGDCKIRIWGFEEGKLNLIKEFEAHKGQVRSISFNPKGNLLASTGDDFQVRIWNFQTGKCLSVLKGHSKQVWCVAFSPDGKKLATGGDNREIIIWDLTERTKPIKLLGHFGPVWSVSFGHDGKLLVSGSGDCTVRLWNIENQKCIHVWEEHNNRVQSVIFHPIKQEIASAGDDETIKMFDLITRECLQTFREPRLYEKMNISGVKGLNDAQKISLGAQGAIEEFYL